MRSFQDIFETGKQPFISAFSICMTVPKYCSVVARRYLEEFFSLFEIKWAYFFK